MQLIFCQMVWGGYVLDGWGGIHVFGSAPYVGREGLTAYWQGWDIARDIVLTPDGKGGHVLDGWGGIHPFGDEAKTSISAYWRRWDIANRIILK